MISTIKMAEDLKVWHVPLRDSARSFIVDKYGNAALRSYEYVSGSVYALMLPESDLNEFKSANPDYSWNDLNQNHNIEE
jgi:hypothetical protein